MRRVRSRRGSALLVVLGMVSFMVISAVAFAAYMRYARLPSSYLRRTSATRQLVKAALAEAIDTVDRAINNNPHPGIGAGGSELTNGRNYNHWVNRVFSGTNLTANALESSVYEFSTVSPLCVEALAYIPPPLVNAVRFYSRHVPSTRWNSFAFDSGRYVWCAVDVSDYFDVNRMMADERRSSAAPRRVTLSYLFEQDEEHSSAPTGADAWDSFMEEFRGAPDNDTFLFSNMNAPLVSMADFNLALGSKSSVGKFQSPFYKYFSGGGSGWMDAGAATTQDMNDNVIGRMTFVTDSLPCPEDSSSTANGDRRDLSNGEDQPFSVELTKSSHPTLFAIYNGNASSDNTYWQSRLSTLGMAILADYLDEDSIPISLAIPTTERAAMVCGIKPQFPSGELKLVASKETEEKTVTVGNQKYTHKKLKVSLNFDNAKFREAFMGTFQALVAYPFSHIDRKEERKFTVGGAVSAFLTSEEMGLRTGTSEDVLHLPSNGNFRNTDLDSNGVFSGELNPSDVTFSDPVSSASDEKNAVKSLKFDTSTIAAKWGLCLNNKPFMQLTYEWDEPVWDVGVNPSQSGGATEQQALANPNQENPTDKKKFLTEAVCNITPLKADGTVDEDFKSENLLKKLQDGGYQAFAEKKINLNAAIWLRVKDGDDAVVDLVPACYADDEMLEGSPNNKMLAAVLNKILGKPYPVMRFDVSKSSLSVNLGDLVINGAERTTELKVRPGGGNEGEALICADPRFNHAPEDWFATDGSLDPETWLNKCGARDREGDIFMATSDAGYLQSKYELAFLPALVSGLKGGGEAGRLKRPDTYTGTCFPNSLVGCVNSELMWRTYDPFYAEKDVFDDLDIVAGGNGPRVNPYSDSTNVILAAFMNTPMDWRCASTNTAQGLAKDAGFESMKASDFNKDYAWNAYGAEDACIEWKDMKKLAGTFIDTMRSERDATGKTSESWKTLWDRLDWNATDGTMWGHELTGSTAEIWQADRKFLYGYWKECFAARQQLFLIFVRAEPAMMGGEGQTPPQLGARAVALVWRDPTKAREARTPHRTRVLFYRQFD